MIKNAVNSERSLPLEVITGIITFAVLIYNMRSMLIYGETTLTHDNYYWYPIFHFFAENIINGQYPTWNPFTHSGEPFYPLISQFRLMEPSALIALYIGRFITDDIVLLFNWIRVFYSLLFCFGIYITFRPWAKHYIIRLSLIPILLYSSLMLSSFRQDGIINQFLWAPYIIFFTLRILYYKDYQWANWLILAVLIGLNWQSYFFTGTSILLLFFFFGLLIFRRDLIYGLINSPGIKTKFAIASFIIIFMMAPNIGLMLEKDNFIYPARMVQSGYEDKTPLRGPQQFEGSGANVDSAIKMPYELIIYSGTFSKIWDYIQILSPEGNNNVIRHPDRSSWGKPSEAYIYFGILPWFIALLGILAGRHDLKKIWLVIIFGFGLLMLGPTGGLHRILYFIYPPMWFVRHTHAFVLFLTFGLLYFYVLGCNHIYCTWGQPLFGHKKLNDRKSFLSFIISDPSLRKFVAVSIFLTCIMLSTYRMTILSESRLSHIFPYIILIFITGWILRKDLERKGLYTSLILGHIGIIFCYTTNPLYFSMYMMIAFMLPIGLFFLGANYKFLSKDKQRALTVAITLIVISILYTDLTYSLKQARSLYQEEKHPAQALNIDMTYQKPIAPQERLIAPDEYIATTYQSMRYLSLLYRKPYVFSPLMTHPESQGLGMPPDEVAQLDHNSFEYALKSIKWSSFIIPLKHYQLTHSEIAPPVLEEMFAVKRPMFQFKKGAIPVDDSKLPTLLNQLGTDNALKLLDDYVFVENNSESIPEVLMEANTIYEKMAQTTPAVKMANQFSYTINDYNYSDFKLRANSDQAGVLYWADGYDKWWRAYLNGKEVPIYRANVNFKAIALPEGQNEIRFSYMPKTFIVSLAFFYGFFILSMTSAIILFIRHYYFSQKTV